MLRHSIVRRQIINNDCLKGKYMEKEFRRPENWLSSPDRQGGWTVRFDDHLMTRELTEQGSGV